MKKPKEVHMKSYTLMMVADLLDSSLRDQDLWGEIKFLTLGQSALKSFLCL